MMKVLVSDIDGGIKFNEDIELVNTIQKFTQQGNLFIVATDKPINYVAEELALSDVEASYYICNDGAVIFDRYFNVIYRKDIKQEVVRPIVNMLKEDDNILEVFIDTSHGFVQNTDSYANGIVARPYDKVKAEILLNSIVLKFPSIHGHINDNWLNIIDNDVNKNEALKYLKEYYHLDKSDIYILGRENNDLEMMQENTGYVLQNTSEDIRKYSHGEVENLKALIDLLLKEEVSDDEETIYA